MHSGTVTAQEKCADSEGRERGNKSESPGGTGRHGGGGGVDSDLLKAAQMGRVRGTIKSQSAWGQGANEGLGSWLSG